jgi:NAD(P)-dependent dehydrogenase (short-subunit alcohol dehydrogenase family)
LSSITVRPRTWPFRIFSASAGALPGVIRTPDLPAAWRAAAPRLPARRLGTPHEIARAARFLLHEESGYITGSALTVSGGYLL